MENKTRDCREVKKTTPLVNHHSLRARRSAKTIHRHSCPINNRLWCRSSALTSRCIIPKSNDMHSGLCPLRRSGPIHEIAASPMPFTSSAPAPRAGSAGGSSTAAIFFPKADLVLDELRLVLPIINPDPNHQGFHFFLCFDTALCPNFIVTVVNARPCKN